MSALTHLGQYWSSERREVRLVACSEVKVGAGRTRGLAFDVTDGLGLPAHRREFRRRNAGAAWERAGWTYRALPTPLLELVEEVEASGGTLPGAAREALERAAGRSSPRELASLDVPPAEEVDHLVAPIVPRRALAFGVTYRNSALEREAEGACGDYGYVYRSVKERGERPELFLKGTSPEHFVGPNGKMGLRGDLSNSLDRQGKRKEREVVAAGIEPELAAVVHSSGRIWGYTLANDVSGNRIENESLLYLAQAKLFTGCLVLGPLILLSEEQENPRLDLTARILRADGSRAFERASSTSRINAPLSSLVAWASSHLVLTPGEVFSTGTDMVPDGEVKVLSPGMTVEIESPAIGLLRHGAGLIGAGQPGARQPGPGAASLNPDHARWELAGASRS